jgi:nucleoside-diphosphate-sugar epimerase
VSYPDVRKVKELLGFEYDLTLEQGLERTISWVKSEPRQ